MTLNTTKMLADQKLAVDTWNQQMKIGDPVTYRDDSGKLFVTVTSSKASVLNGHTAVVWLEGKSGCVALDRVTPLEFEP